MRALTLGLVLVASTAASTAFVPLGSAKDEVPAKGQALGDHPHFDDGGAIRWATSLAQAQAAAKKADKLIFIEFGREA